MLPGVQAVTDCPGRLWDLHPWEISRVSLNVTRRNWLHLGFSLALSRRVREGAFRGLFQDSLVFDSVNQICKSHRGFCSDLFAAVFSPLPHVQAPSKESFWITIPSPAASTLNTAAPSLPTHRSSFLSSKVTCPYSPSFWDVHELSEGCSGFSSSRECLAQAQKGYCLLYFCLVCFPSQARQLPRVGKAAKNHTGNR